MSTVGETVLVKGEVRSSEDLTIEGHVEGQMLCEGHAVIIGASADVTGDVFARDITVLGRSTGRLVATDVVDIRAGAVVTGQVMSKRFILNDGATFNGRAEPQHLEAALRVAHYQDKRQVAESAPGRIQG